MTGSKDLYNLEALIKGGVTSQFKKSFYHYLGSFSTPGCENIGRIVMSERLLISSNALEDSKKIMSQVIDETNSRDIQNAGTEGPEYTT